MLNNRQKLVTFNKFTRKIAFNLQTLTSVYYFAFPAILTNKTNKSL